ncbi:unnamed protein product [Protopolystoma xenopodis]|uniref:Uncharacterized protein n=1 Tax=Protopolystoma xenopodis TaxID=117903 RepID=A0A448XBF5_9PLAT|nr:unnamed protein product [Protopolystoma xenopodis]
MSCSLVLRPARLTGDADYDAGKTSENAPSLPSDAGYYRNYCGRGLLARCVQLGRLDNTTKLSKWARITSKITECLGNKCLMVPSNLSHEEGMKATWPDHKHPDLNRQSSKLKLLPDWMPLLLC